MKVGGVLETSGTVVGETAPTLRVAPPLALGQKLLFGQEFRPHLAVKTTPCQPWTAFHSTVETQRMGTWLKYEKVGLASINRMSGVMQ